MIQMRSWLTVADNSGARQLTCILPLGGDAGSRAGLGDVITAAVKEGRTVHNNIEKAMLFLLATNVAQAPVIAVPIFFGFSVPITAPQVLRGQYGHLRRA